MSIIGYLTTTEALLNADELPASDFDLVIGLVSWEGRCRTITKWTSLKATKGLLFRFGGGLDYEEAKDLNLGALQDFYAESFGEYEYIILPPSTKIASAFERISAHILKFCASASRRIRLLLDISSMPRSMINFIILFCFKNQLVDSVQIFFGVSDHAESVKLIREKEVGSRYPLVEGKWELNAVPYAEGALTASRTDHIVLSLGLDTYQILDVIERLEPWSALFLVPARNDNSDIDLIALDQEKLLRGRFGAEFESNRYQLMHISPYSLNWVTDVEKLLLIRMQDEGAIMLCPFGPKIHSVGLTLLALRFDEAALIGRTPTSYFNRQVDGTDRVAMLELIDISSPSAARLKSARTLEPLAGM